MDKIRVGAVSYRNAKPLVFGLEQPDMTNIIDLTYDYPARLVEQLLSGQIDIGLIPVAAMKRIPNAHIVGQHGIAADGAVGSVALFSTCPIEEVEEVVLDYQSRTSVELTKILLRDHWKRPVRFIPSQGDEYINDISGARAGLIIGDRALMNVGRFPYVYDLSQAWKDLTGLPFVFAVWVTVCKLPTDFVTRFEQANAVGLLQLEQLAKIWSLEGVDILTYFQRQIHYLLDANKRKGLNYFLELLENG